jgi:hypothetical protein
MLAVTPARRRRGGGNRTRMDRLPFQPLIRRRGYSPSGTGHAALSPLSYGPVGHRGVGPRCTRLSDGPRHRLSRGQRMRSESNAQGREARPGSGRVPSPIGLRILERIAEVPPPSAFGAHPGSSRRPLLGGFTIHGGRYTDRTCAGRWPRLPVSGRAPYLSGNLP